MWGGRIGKSNTFKRHIELTGTNHTCFQPYRDTPKQRDVKKAEIDHKFRLGVARAHSL